MYKISESVIVNRKAASVSGEAEAVFLENPLLNGEVEIAKPYLRELEEILTKGTETIGSELETFLFEHRYLVEENIADSEVGQLLAVMDETLIICIMPTLKCNFRCVYCYEEHEGGEISKTSLEHIKHFVEEKIKKHKIRHVQVNWFGGEPTLCAETICDFNSFILGLREKYRISFSSGITSNGYLLDAELFQKFYELGIEDYQITIDGWKHDEFRKYVTGEPTLRKIIDNLKAISSLPENYRFGIRLRYNISEKNQDKSWYDYIKEQFGGDERFSMYINFVRDWGGESVRQMELCAGGETDRLEQEHVRYMETIGLRNQNAGETLLTPLKNVCYAAYPHSYIFTPDDRVLKCTLALEEEPNRIGEVRADAGVVIDREKEKAWTETTIEYCEDCKYVLSCLHRACPREVAVDRQPEETCVFYHEWRKQ